MSASYMSGAGGRGSSLLAFQVRFAELSYAVSGLSVYSLGYLCIALQSCSAELAGADEEFRLAMEFLRPAYGQVKCRSHLCMNSAVVAFSVADLSVTARQSMLLTGVDGPQLRVWSVHAALCGQQQVQGGDCC